MTEEILKRGFLNDTNVIYNVPDIPVKRLGRNKIREKLKLNENKIHIAFVAAKLRDTYKGYEYYEEAVNILKRLPQNREIEFHALGQFTREKENNVNITYHNYESNYNKLIEFLEGLDILVIPSVADHIPNLILEAAFVGTLPLASNINGISELQERLNLRSIKPRDSQDIASKLNQEILSKNYLNRAELEKVSRTYFNSRIELDKLISIYNKF